MAARGVSTDYSSRLVQKEVHGVKLKGYVAHSRVLADVAVGGGGEGAASGRLWCVRWYDTTEEEELLEADLLPLLVPGPRGGGKGSGGKAAQPAAPARLVARKVAERPPPFEEGANAGPLFALPAAPPRKRPAGAAPRSAQPVNRKRRVPPPPQPPAPADADEADPLSTLHLEMKGAAVEDDELPKLLNGEVRVLGQTLTRTAALARSRAVAEWRRQGRDKQQWAEILSPMADADKAAVLRSLRDFLKLTAGQELVSALPPDPPCSSLVEKFEIPGSDPRVALRGQFGVRVKPGGPPLQPFVVVGTYRAFTPTHEEYNHFPAYKYGSDERVWGRLSHKQERRGANEGEALGAEVEMDITVEMDISELLFDSFAADYELWNQRPGVGDNPLPQPPPPGGVANAGADPASPVAPMPQLMASAYGFGNMMCLINDGLGPRPKGMPALSEEESEQVCNAKLIEVLVHGWPAIVVVTVKQVQPGQELLLLYGDGYWEQLRQLAARLQGHRTSLAAQQQRLRFDGIAQAASAASGGEGGGSAAAQAAGAAGGGSGQGAAPPKRFAPTPAILAEPGRGAAAAHHVSFAVALPSYEGAAFDRGAAKRHAAAEGAAAFEPAASAADFEALVECRDGMSAAEAADAARAARALSDGLAAAAAEAPAEGEPKVSIADALQRARTAAEERGRELAKEVAAAK